MEPRYYEGCGKEGPIRCIFLCEFHPVAGPKITCQFPDDYVSKEIFDAISVYIIPKPQLQKCTMTINAFGHKIIGYPIRIDDSRYERNAFLFNLCFVCDSWSKTVQYEPVVKKLGEHLTIMELETRFVSNGSTRLSTMLAHLVHDLNTYRQATVVEGDTVMYLKVLEVRNDPAPVHDYDVPIFTYAAGLNKQGAAPIRTIGVDEVQSNGNDVQCFDTEEEPFHISMEDDWDLTTRQILPFIDGYKHVAEIAALANIERNLVKACVQNLLYYNAISLLPVLKFCNVYRATPKLSQLFNDEELQKACLSFITSKNGNGSSKDLAAHQPMLSDVFQILCGLQQGTTLKAVCERFTASKNGTIDIRRLIVFALLHDMIKCLKRYPVYMKKKNSGEPLTGIRSLFNGRHSIDEICCLVRIHMPLLERIIDEDPDVLVISR